MAARSSCLPIRVTKLRMELASDNLPSAGVGYEIFDKSDAFGATAFVQNINMLRALEGELSRSIQTIDGIQAARIHLVIPEREIFSRDAQPPSASVVLKTRERLDHGQVQAIQHLVAAAVAGLAPERVAVVDDRGELLAGGEDKSGADANSADQEQHTTDYEDKMRQRIESIVASIVGTGHVRAQVAATLNYGHTSETSELFDPDSKVVRSTQTVDQNSTEADQSANNAVSVANALYPAASNRAQHSRTTNPPPRARKLLKTTNYEISKTVKTSTADGGDIKRLSVAVAVDNNDIVDADGKVTSSKPRSPQEMAQIEVACGIRHGLRQDTRRRS